MPPKRRPTVAGDSSSELKVPQDVSLGTSFLKDAAFTCTLCKNKIEKGTETVVHFKEHHKITKVGAIEKLVTLGVVIYDPEKQPTDEVMADFEAEQKQQQQRQEVDDNVSAWARGDLVLAHVTGYPWWPGVIQKTGLVEADGTAKVDVRFFDKDMQTSKVKLAQVKEFKDYHVYLRSKRKVFSAATLGKLRQAYEFSLKVQSKASAWRHTYFCVDKHTMFDFNATHDETEDPVEEAPLTKAKPRKTKRRGGVSKAQASGGGGGEPLAAKKSKAAAAAPAKNEGGTNPDRGKTETAETKHAEEPDDNDEEEVPGDSDIDECENDVNDVLNEMGYDN